MGLDSWYVVTSLVMLSAANLDQDAEHAADDGAMIMSGMDLSYLGIYSIWTNDLGRSSEPYGNT